MGAPWTDQDITRMRDMLINSQGPTAIGKALGRTTLAVGNKMIKLGLRYNVKPTWSKDRIVQIRELSAQGLNKSQLAKAMSLTTGQIIHGQVNYVEKSSSIDVDFFIRHGHQHATPANSVAAQCRMNTIKLLQRAKELNLTPWPAPLLKGQTHAKSLYI